MYTTTVSGAFKMVKDWIFGGKKINEPLELVQDLPTVAVRAPSRGQERKMPLIPPSLGQERKVPFIPPARLRREMKSQLRNGQQMRMRKSALSELDKVMREHLEHVADAIEPRTRGNKRRRNNPNLSVFFGRPLRDVDIRKAARRVYDAPPPKRFKVSREAKDTPLDPDKTADVHDRKNQCVVCWNAHVATVIIDCGHMIMCNACARKGPKRCAMCKTAIEHGIITTFAS